MLRTLGQFKWFKLAVCYIMGASAVFNLHDLALGPQSGKVM